MAADAKVLDAVLRAHVLPLLKAAGFTKHSGRVFRRRADNGDEAQIVFRTWRLGEREVEFYVDAGVLPAPYAEFIAESSGRKAPAGQVLYTERLRSPATDLGLWQFDQDDDAAIAQLQSELRGLTERLVHLLDRENLIALVKDPATPVQSLALARPRALALLLSDR